MVIMPDGAKFKMNWKYITYVNHGNSIHFSIVPMYNGPDIVLFPNMENWEKDGAFSLEEREEIIFLLEHLNWKRNLKIVEANVPAQKSEKAFVQKGSLETTNAYAALARKNLFDFLDIDVANTNIENGKAEDREKECERYNALLHEMQQDVQILGIGSNGHIAFNEPGTPFGSETHIVDLTESTIKDNSRLFARIEDVPRQAFTMGLKNIMNAKKIVILANGKNKAKAVYGLVKGPVTEDLPASVLQLHPDCTVVIDEEAASLL